MKISKKITFPTYFTLLRLLIAPIMVPFFIVRYVPNNIVFINAAVAAIFLLFGFTDYLDGFFARKYCQESQLGATLDHLADKFLTFSAFIALLAIGKISYVWVLLLVGREIFMMGLREIALEHHVTIKVSSFGKLKTCVQIAAIAWIIFNPAQHVIGCWFNYVESIILWIGTILAWYSALLYFLVFYRSLQK